MKNIVRRSICLLLAFVCLMSCCAITAAAVSPVTGVASDQWKQALDSTKSKTSYYSPYMAASNSEEYYSKIGTGHLQGMCVDDDLRYMYVSYTDGIGKIDMATGEVAGYLTGFDGGLHIGCLAYYDGYIYGSFEAQATHKFYIIQVDESQFWGVMDTREKWLDAVRVILLYEPTVDARDLMGDTWDNGDGIAGRNEEVGHRYSNAGIDGVTFGTYPGEFGKENADVYMFVSYGTYWFTNGDTTLSNRLDDEHIILQAYNTKDFLNEQNQSQYLLELAYTDTTTPDQNGVSNARSIYYADDSILHAEKAMFVFVGNTRWGCQQIEYDRTTGDIWLSTYGASDGSPVAGTNWHVIDGSKTPQHKEIQLGQNADASKLIYGDLGKKNAAQKAEIVTAAKERAKRYGDNVKVANSTWDTWKYKPQGGFSENGYPVADIPYLKCVCGNCKNGLDGKGDYIGYTKANGYDTDNMICCGLNQYMCMGLVSLGNGYWYWDGASDTQDCLKLFHMDGFDAKTGAVGKARNITDANLADYVAMETAAGTLTSTVEEAKRTLQTRVTKTEQNYPTNAAGYSDASWTALQNALSGAKAVLADSSATAEQADAAMETLKTALKGMRKTAEFEAAVTESERMSSKLYGAAAIAAYKTKADAAKTGSETYSQTKLDTLAAELNTLHASMMPDINKDFEETKQAVETGKDVDLTNGGWELLQITVPTGKTAKITADGLVIRSLSAGTYNVPIANVASMRIDGTADAGVCRYKDLRTIAGITVDSKALYGFDRETYTYTVKIPTKATEAPKVGVTPVDGCDAKVEITQAAEAEGTARIVVTRADETKVTYTVKFVRDSSQDDVVTPAPETTVYASDLDPVWVTTYPNHRGHDGKNERFMRDHGWQFENKTDVVELIGLDAQGGKKSYSKGFTLHGITSYGMINGEPELEADGSRKSDAEIKKGYTDDNDLIRYSSVRFDVSNYTKFTTTLSTAWEQYSGSQNTSLTVNIYCDDELKESYKLHCKANSENEVGHDVSIDLTGVSYLTIQVDPENVDGVGNPDDWANGDIVTFGDAKFYKPAVETKTNEVWATDAARLWTTTYPNYRGLDGKNERFMANKSWSNPGNDLDNPNVSGETSLAAAGANGERIVYDHGFTLHAITNYGMPANSEEHTFSEVDSNRTQMNGTKLHDNWVAHYKAEFQKTDAATYFKGLSEAEAAARAEEYYSSVSFDVSGYDRFTAAMGSYYPKGDGGNANATVRIYLDGVLQTKTYKVVGGSYYPLDIDLTGVSRMTIQVDPKNDGTPGNDSDWANRDIIGFGNAKFYQTTAVTEDTYLNELSAPSTSTTATASGVNWVHLVPDTSVFDKDGSELKFTKGITIEPFVKSQVPSGYTEQSYRESFVNGTNGRKYIDYSSVTWDISGKGYESFDATVGVRYPTSSYNTSANSDVVINFYVDGVLVPNATCKFLGSSAGASEDRTSKDVHIDLIGAKTFTIQVDPYGQGKLKLDDYANQDITVFGNAKFSREKLQGPTTTKPQDEIVYLCENIIDPTPDACLSISASRTVTESAPASGVHFMNKDDPTDNSTYGSSLSDQVTFQHWLRIEPLVAEQVGWITGTSKSEAMGAGEIAYRDLFVNGVGGKKFSDYSSITWNIEGKGYDQFKCTLGPRWNKQGSATDVTVIFYVDGVEVLRKNIRSKTLGTDINIDLTGAKTFTIQLDPLGDGTKTDDLASGDILIFGDARFVKLANRLTHTHTPASEWTQGEYGHWHACSGCAEHLNYEVHVPSGEPTEQTPQTCLICGKEIKEKLKHEPKRTASVAPTCTTPGNIEYFYCPNCGKYYSDEDCTQELVNGPADAFREATGHSMTHVGAVEPTYDHVGNIEYWYCSACRKYFADGQGAQELTGSVILPKKEAPSIILPILPVNPGTPSYELPFVDVPEGEWYYESVYYAWDADLINGTSPTTFRPDNTLTVAEAIKLAAALHQLESEGKVTLRNGQVNWYDTYVAYAVKEGIIEAKYQRYTVSQMNAPATRREFVHILHGALDDYAAINAIGENAIPDVKTGDTYAAEIYDFYRAGILTGSNAEGTFHPESSIKRSEVAAILIRMYDESMRLEKTL